MDEHPFNEMNPLIPTKISCFRGENGPTCYALSPVEGDPEKCLFRWLLDTDLKVSDDF